MTLSEDGDDLLHREADLLGRYLVGRAPGGELCERYVAAHRELGLGLGSPRDSALMSFVRRHPWSLAVLDAAAGWLAPRCMLRRKALLMTAILEATPDFLGEFLPRPAGWPSLLARLAGLGVAAGLKLVAGCLLWPLAVARASSKEALR